MLAEAICHVMGWEAVWMPDAGTYFPWWPHFIVGTWTGPDADLLCVKRCETNEEAERWLSPRGYTILHAVALALWVRLWRSLVFDDIGE